jgi:hypothetical protein
MPSPSHPFDFTTRTILGKEYRSLNSSLCNFLHSPVTSSLLGPNALLSNLFPNTLAGIDIFKYIIIFNGNYSSLLSSPNIEAKGGEANAKILYHFLI